MFLGNINTIPSIVNLPGQSGAGPAPPAPSTFDFEFAHASNNSFQVDSTEYPNPQQYNVITGNYSISCLIKIDADFFVNPGDGVTKNYRIVDKENIQAGTPRGYGINLVNTTSATSVNTRAFRISAYRSGSNVGNGRANITFGSNLSAGTIYFIVATVDVGSGEVKLYVKTSSGQPFNTQTKTLGGGSGFILNSTGAFSIGNTSPSSATQGFGGEIDEIATWTSVLTSTQVDTLTTLYRNNDSVNLSTALGGSPQPAGWYKMGEGASFNAGTTVWNMPNDGNNSNFKNLKSDAVLESARKSPGLVPQF